MKTKEVIRLLARELKIWEQCVSDTEQFHKEVFGNKPSRKNKYLLKRQIQIVADFKKAIEILSDINLKLK